MDSLKNAGPACMSYNKSWSRRREIGCSSCRKEEEQKLNLASEILFAAFEKGGMQALKDLTIEHAINLYQIIDI